MKSFIDEYKETEVEQILESKHNSYISVDYMRDGSLGVALSSLGLVIRKIYYQMYGFKRNATISTQTLNRDDWNEMTNSMGRDQPISKLKLGITSRIQAGRKVNEQMQRGRNSSNASSVYNKQKTVMKSMNESSRLNRTIVGGSDGYDGEIGDKRSYMHGVRMIYTDRSIG